MPLLTFLTRPGATVGDESSDAGARRRSRGLCAPGATWRPQSTQTLAPGTCKCDLILKIRSSQRGEGQSGVTCVLVRKGNLDVTYREKMRERGSATNELEEFGGLVYFWFGFLCVLTALHIDWDED